MRKDKDWEQNTQLGLLISDNLNDTFFYDFLILRERERKLSVSWGEGPRKSQAASTLGTQPHNSGIMTWAKIKSWTLNQMSHPGAP